MLNKKFIATLLVATAAAFVTTSSFAADDANPKKAEWLKNHPRRAEVNARLANQDKRINTERKEGEISNQQAAKLHKEDHKIRLEERRMAAKNDGHITKQEKRKLNRQENKVSQQIGQ